MPVDLPRRARNRLRVLICVGAVGLVGSSSTGGTESAAADGRGPTVVACCYLLVWLGQQVVGDLGTVESHTPPGTEPHDHELTRQDVAPVLGADLVVHLPTLQPAVDEAVGQQAADTSFDAGGADLDLEAATATRSRRTSTRRRTGR